MKILNKLKLKKSPKLYLLFLLLSLVSFTASAEFQPLDPELTNYSYPQPVSYFTQKIQKQDVKMAYMDVSSEKPNGKVVVLLHGKNFSGNYWENTMNALVKEGYRVIVPDQVGFGKSSKPDSFQYSFHLLGKMTFALLKDLKVNQVYLVGHSMGGMLATRMSLMNPGMVKKLILVNPIGLEDWKVIVPYQSVDEIYNNELNATEDSIRNYQKANYFDGQWRPEYEKQIEIQVGWTKHPEYKRVAWNSALTAEMIMTQPVLYEFKNLRVPTVLMVGTRDKTALGKNLVDEKTRAKMGDYSKLGKQVIKQIKRGVLVEIPKVGHMPQVEVFDTYIKYLVDNLK